MKSGESKRRRVLLTRPIWRNSEGLKKKLKGEEELVAKERGSSCNAGEVQDA